MGSYPLSERTRAGSHTEGPARAQWAFSARTAVVLAFIGVLCSAWPVLHNLWRLWLHDPLRSLGGVLAFVSVALVAKNWNYLHWEMNGSWWGLLPLAWVVALLRPNGPGGIYVIFHGFPRLNLVAPGLTLAILFSSFLLMCGGKNVWRRCLFPLVLLLCVRVVPTAFERQIDLPLQRYSANTARHFATALGEHPDGSELRLMFSPGFGMFIAPGCNGIRGAVTLGYLGLIVAYWIGLNISMHLLATGVGVLIGYIFNFIRLCILVLYYKLGQSFPFIQPYGSAIDYAIGGTLFFSVCLTLGLLLGRKSALQHADLIPRPLGPVRLLAPAVFVTVVFLLSAPSLWALAKDLRHRPFANPLSLEEIQFPAQVGSYRLSSRWDESNLGTKVYLWGRYTDGIAGEDLLVGLWVARSCHTALDSHVIRGEQIQLGADIRHLSSVGLETVYNTFSYSDGFSNFDVASGLSAACDDHSNLQASRHFGFVVTPSAHFGKVNVSVASIVIKRELPPGNIPMKADDPRLDAFISSLDESALMMQSQR